MSRADDGPKLNLRILSAITLGYGLAYTCRLAIGVVKKPLIDGGIFSASELGLIGSALFFAYAVGKLCNGFLADHLNPRIFLTIGFLLTSACCFFMGFTTSVVLAAFLWGLNGWFQSFGAPGSVVSLTASQCPSLRGRAYGIWSTSHSIGEGLTFLLIVGVVGYVGWQWGYWVSAACGLMAAALSFVLLRDVRPPVDENATHRRVEMLKAQLSILRMPAIWILGLASALVYVTRYAINSWGILYLEEARGLSLEGAGALIFMSNLAGIGGAIAFGFLSDIMFHGRRPPANLVFAIVEIVGLLIIFFGPASLITLTIGLFLFGLGLTGLVTSLGGLFATDIAPAGASGAALGVIGIFSYLGSALQEWVSGILIERNSILVGGTRHYDFSQVIYVWVGASVLSMILAAALWRKQPSEVANQRDSDLDGGPVGEPTEDERNGTAP